MIPNKVILHHSATKDSGTVSWNAIRRYHTIDKGWGHIGYQFGIERIDDPGSPEDSFEIMFGCMPDEVGFHTIGQNSQSIGICFIGSFDDIPPCDEQIRQGVKLVRWICKEFGIDPEAIYGHRDFANKTCPGNMFDIEQFREKVKQALGEEG